MRSPLAMTKTLTVAALSAALLIPAVALAGRGGSETLIIQAVQSGSEDTIIAEVERAEFLACLGCIQVVRDLVDFPSTRVRNVAGWFLTRRGVRSAVINDMTARLSAQDPVAARNAADVLGGMLDIRTAPALVAYLSRPLDEDSAVAAIEALSNMGDSALVTVLQTNLRSPMAKVRAAAAVGLQKLRAPVGQSASNDGSALIPLLTDADSTVRNQAALSAGFLGARLSATVIPALVQAAGSDAAAQVRKSAAWALGRTGSATAQAVLTAAQNDADSGVRSTARIALAGLKH